MSLDSQSDCLLRCSQSCLEQSLFRDHFGPNGGPSVCLRRLKVLRDMTRTFDTFCFYPGLTFNCKNGIDQTAWEFITTEPVSVTGKGTNVIFKDGPLRKVLLNRKVTDGFHHTPSKHLWLLFCPNGVKPQKTSSGLCATSANVLWIGWIEKKKRKKKSQEVSE